jgi:ATP-dependent Zn protease
MKRFNYILPIALLCSIFMRAQNPTVIEAAPNTEYYEETYEEEPIVTPSREERGQTYYQQRNLDPKFKEEYKGKQYNYDRVLKPKEKKERKPPSFSLPTGFFSFLMYTILAIVVLSLVYFILKNAGGFQFGTARQKIKINSSTEKEWEDVEHIENNDFPRLIQNAKDNKDYRRAIRYYYLWVLQKLTDRNFIKFNKDKTDYEYFLELGQNPIREDFSHTNYIYDYIWYGNFSISEREFAIAESIFQRTLKKLG